MSDPTKELIFQNEVVAEMVAGGWKRGKPENYDRALALYPEDVIGFVKDTQPEQWEKFCALYPASPEQKLLERIAEQLNKADPNAADQTMRTFGTLGVLRHELRDRGTRFSLCQFKPEHDLNPDTLARYGKNRLRVVPELVYSPWATEAELATTGVKAKAWRIDLVLFVNGLPVATLELKSEFKQAADRAIKQYKSTRLPVDPVTKKPEPLLTFKRGALVHFAVSQYEVAMTTRLAGEATVFLPFNRGTAEGGAGNDVPDDTSRYATDYLWSEVLLPDNLLNILARFVHLEIKEKEDWDGRKYKQEAMIFPRYHQWDVVSRLVETARAEGPGHKYLIQHSAGSGKSNSIAWVAHQLSALYTAKGTKQFHSVIVVTDRTVLDDQLQETIYQFEHTDGVVGRINRDEGEGSKSEKLAAALENSQPIIIVTIQTFPFVLRAIENSVSLKERCYAIIADEAHSSQSGSTARQLKEVLMIESSGADDDEISSDDMIEAAVASRRANANLSFLAFTATPKTKTLELFGRLPNPAEAPSKKNKPAAFHVYSMRHAIEEGFILDVLKNYTNYKVAYQLALKIQEADEAVESRKAQVKLNRWVRLHDYNIAQKVQVIVEHFKTHVMGLLGGHAKAMVVTGSRKEAVRYKLSFDRYITEKGYQKLYGMAAFSGEVEFSEKDPDSAGLLGQKFTEVNMNPGLKGRDMRKAFDSQDYQVMIVANKFQTGFDQPKLCAMYVDKKLGGVECVQTLSRLNRVYPGKADTGTFVLDFFNAPEDILAAFQPYFKTASLADVSDPNLIFDLNEKLRASGIFQGQEVEQFCTAFFQKSKSNAALANICKPAMQRWQIRYKAAMLAYQQTRDMLERTKKTGDAVLMANAENMIVAGRVLAVMPTVRRANSSEDEWTYWLNAHTIRRSNGTWLSDRRDPAPEKERDWVHAKTSEHWSWSIQQTDFLDVLTRQAPVPGWIVARGDWNDCKFDRTETMDVSSALVDPATAESLANSCRWSEPYRYYLPLFEQENPEVYSVPPFDLAGWIAHGRHSDDARDTLDPYAKNVDFPPFTIGRTYSQLLNLERDEEMRHWWFGGTEVKAALAEVWSDGIQKHRDPPRRQGTRFSVSLELLRRLCLETGKYVIFSVQIGRSIERNYGSGSDLGNPTKSHQIFIYTPDGYLHGAKKSHRIG